MCPSAENSSKFFFWTSFDHPWLWVGLILFGCVAGATKVQAEAEAAPPAPTVAPPVESNESGTISLDFKEADINTVLRVMSIKSRVNIVAGPEVKGSVTIRLENVPWEKALEVVLRTYGYVYERDGNVIRVTTRENLAAEPVITQTYILNYSKPPEIQAAVQDMLTERGRIKTADRTNTIVITDIPTNLYRVGEVIKKLDKVTPQAYIDSKVIKTNVGLTENLGIEWKTGGTASNLGSLSGATRPTTFPFQNQDRSNPSVIEQFFPYAAPATTVAVDPVQPRAFPEPKNQDPTNGVFSFGTLNFSSFSAVLQMLKTRSDTKVLSNPRIVVLSNQTAQIHVGDNIPLPRFETNTTTGRLTVSGFDYDKLKTGVNLKVTPHINSAEEILVDLQPSVKAQGATLAFNQDLSAPIINETTASTQVLIRSGETIAIGGLMTDNVQSSESKVPYLGDVPVVGKLFRSKRQTPGSGNEKVETLFFVTVTMVDTAGQPAGERAKLRQKAAPGASKDATPPAQKKVANSGGKTEASTESSNEKLGSQTPAAVSKTVAVPTPTADAKASATPKG